MEQYTDIVLLDAILPNGAVVKVEAATIGSAQDVALLPTFSLEGIEKTLVGFAEIVKQAVAKATPDSMELEFGLKLGLDGGKLISMLAHAKSEASLTVRLGWNQQIDKPPARDDDDPSSQS
jgi:hypothetical protein